MKIALQHLLNKEDIGGHYGRSYIEWESIRGFVDTVYQGEEHFAGNYLIVLELDGQLYGFEDWQNSEGENGISEDYTANHNVKLELEPVIAKQVTTYAYA